MATVGFVINPMSGKDVRRIVSSATTIDNQEKANIAERAAYTLREFGKEHRVILMPDGYDLSERILNRFHQHGLTNCEVYKMHINENHTDTTRFVSELNEQGCSLFIVMGGDGTSRAAAKAIGDTPLIPISTGTNNVYPKHTEGTVVGLAAAAILGGYVSPEEACSRSKRIEVYINGEFVDIALIDAVISSHLYVGSKAIWELNSMNAVFAAQAHPASIGFSALAGAVRVITEQDDAGLYIGLDPEKKEYRASIAAGKIESYGLSEQKLVPVGGSVKNIMDFEGIVALDGERERRFHKGDELELRLTRNGPLRVDVERTVALAQAAGMFIFTSQL